MKSNQLTVFVSTSFGEAIAFAAILREQTKSLNFSTKPVHQGFEVVFNGDRDQLDDLTLWIGQDVLEQILTF